MLSFSFSSSYFTNTKIQNKMANVNKKNKYILITNGDSYIGRNMAIHIADELAKHEGQMKKSHWRVRLLCENKHKLEYLEKRGIDVKQVDYESPHMLREQMQDHIKTMIFNPFAKNDGRMVVCAKNLIDAAVHEKVKRVIMLSSLGCDYMSENDTESPMRQFKQAEDYFRNCFQYGYWLIFRIPLMQQFMYFWRNMIESKNKLGMPLPKDCTLMTVNVRDVLECISVACLSKKSSVWSAYSNQEDDTSSSDDLFELPNPAKSRGKLADAPRASGMKKMFMLKSMQPMSLKMIAESLMHALQEEGSNLKIDTMVMKDDELRSYLKFVSEDSVGGHSDSPLSEADVSKSKSHHEDHPAWNPVPKWDLMPFQVELMLDHFKMARFSDMPILLEDDIRDILGREPIELREFFMMNRRQFRPTAKKQ
ncbi:MAG: hypothetical protein EXX96DRAFT_345094 [Benjaminiella poitrasii]|nr:MAG: hypothetical protein EXX96DRAFT_345094 [Benjaminiella poitrasii]